MRIHPKRGSKSVEGEIGAEGWVMSTPAPLCGSGALEARVDQLLTPESALAPHPATCLFGDNEDWQLVKYLGERYHHSKTNEVFKKQTKKFISANTHARHVSPSMHLCPPLICPG